MQVNILPKFFSNPLQQPFRQTFLPPKFLTYGKWKKVITGRDRTTDTIQLEIQHSKLNCIAPELRYFYLFSLAAAV